MERILGFYPKGLSAKKLQAPKLYKVRHLRCRQTCLQHFKGEITRFQKIFNQKLNAERRSRTFSKKKNVENLVEMKKKRRLRSVLKGDLPTCSFFAF